MNDQLKKLKLKVHGMHCAACEVLIERKFQKLEGVEKVRTNFGNGHTEVFYTKEPRLHELQNAIKGDGYTLSLWSDRNNTATVHAIHKNTGKDYFQIGAVFLIILASYLLLKQFDLIPKSLGITGHMSYGFVFLIGLVAAVSSCIAVTGGLLLALAAKYNESNPDLTGIQKFKPHIYFNLGRIMSYTVLGGVVGAIGSVITLSTRASGFLTIAVSLVMIMLGFQLLHLFPWMRQFSPRMPKFLAHRIHDMSTKETRGGAFILGTSTFFLPCGFTQALQLYVLANGSFMTGALTMLVFSLGTLPALLSLGLVSSFAKGKVQGYFLKFAGVLVILFGVFNVNNGLALTGSTFDLFGPFVSAQTTEPAAQIVDGKQIVKMKVSGYTYSPNRFTVVQGVPVEWQIDGAGAVGCGQVLIMPTTGITKYLSPQGITTITFTPTETGTIPFNCSMGMMTRGSAFTVVANTTGIAGAAIPDTASDPSACDPTVTTCLPAQKFDMEISAERGFYPNSFTVKQGVPVEVNIDDKVQLGGCMTVMVIPQYQVTLPLKLGANTLKFTPTEGGLVFATCSMGTKMIQFNVTS